MRACPSCYALNQDDAKFCAECQVAMLVEHTAKGKELSSSAIAAAQVRRDFVARAPSSGDLSAQQWYNVCKWHPQIAQRASAYTHRPLASIGEHNPLDKTSSRGFRLVIQRRQREPGEEG